MFQYYTRSRMAESQSTRSMIVAAETFKLLARARTDGVIVADASYLARFLIHTDSISWICRCNNGAIATRQYTILHISAYWEFNAHCNREALLLTLMAPIFTCQKGSIRWLIWDQRSPFSFAQTASASRGYNQERKGLRQSTLPWLELRPATDD